MVRVAVLGAVVVLAATVNPTPPEPVRLAPLVIVTHGAPLVAVQLHPVAVVTETLLLAPLADIDWLVDDIMYEQDVPTWVTVKVFPPTVSVPVRGVVPGFAATV